MARGNGERFGRQQLVHETRNFLCLSDLDPEKTRTLLAYAESVLSTIRGMLKDAAWTGYHGKHVLMFFSDPEDYFAYISFFYPEGAHPSRFRDIYNRWLRPYCFAVCECFSAENVIVHELLHNLLCHLRIPAWLNEGLAVMIEAQVAHRSFHINHELADRHCRHWNEENIQAFWAGRSFHTPGDDSELSYSLGGIFVTLLSRNGADFIAFITKADWRDAGQDAALTFLDRDLGEVAAEFLGPGNWRPQRKAIAEYFHKKTK